MSVDDRPRAPASTSSLLTDAGRLLRANPRVFAGFVLAGVVVTVVDALRRGDPVPTVGFVGLLDGDISVTFGLVARITPHASTPLSALASLRTPWLLWTAGLELLRTGAVVGAGVYGFARLLETTPSPATVLRYLVVFWGLALLSFEADVGLLLGIPLLILFFAVLVRLVAFPALLVSGSSITGALSQSWYRTAGDGWALFGVVFVVGSANHALASVPTVGPVGSALAAAVQVAAVAGYVDRIR